MITAIGYTRLLWKQIFSQSSCNEIQMNNAMVLRRRLVTIIIRCTLRFAFCLEELALIKLSCRSLNQASIHKTEQSRLGGALLVRVRLLVIILFKPTLYTLQLLTPLTSHILMNTLQIAQKLSYLFSTLDVSSSRFLFIRANHISNQMNQIYLFHVGSGIYCVSCLT